MLQRYSKFVILLLVAGIFYGCGATNPNIESAKIQIKNKAYKEALEAANQAISQDSTNALGYFYKGVALSEMAAQEQDLDKQHQLYERMVNTLDKAKKYFAQQENPPREAQRTDLILASTWAQQYNRGVKYLTIDSLRSQQGYQKAIKHLKNARVAQPDSVMTYDALAQAYLQLNPQNLEGAIQSLQNAISKADTGSYKQYRQLAAVYAQNNQIKESAQVLEKARQVYPDSTTLVRQLSGAYFAMGQRDKALDMIKELIRKDPNNPRYHKVLGTQIYQEAQPLNDSLRSNFDQIFNLQTKIQDASSDAEIKKYKQKIEQIEKENKKLQERLVELRNRALEQLKKVVELDSKDHETYETIGIIYQNQAAIWDNKRNITIDNELAEKYDKKARKELKKALNYYKKAVELDSDNKGYWRHLFRVYTRLGMAEKAKEASKKAGL